MPEDIIVCSDGTCNKPSDPYTVIGDENCEHERKDCL